MYRFPVDCQIKPNFTFPISQSGYVWEFETTEGRWTHLRVTVPLPEEWHWPKVTLNPAPGFKFLIDPNMVHLPFLRVYVRSIQSVMSLYGVNSINTTSFEAKWIAESEDERRKLHLTSWGPEKEHPAADDGHRFPFDMLARTILGGIVEGRIEMPLSFFRRASSALVEREYIQAIYGFFFVIESLFGEGKSRTAQLRAALENSKYLSDAITTILKRCPTTRQSESFLRQDFAKKFAPMSVSQYISHIVELRGFLHHHTHKRRDIWHPENQEKYQLDALILADICYRVLFQQGWTQFDRQKVKDEYIRQAEGWFEQQGRTAK